MGTSEVFALADGRKAPLAQAAEGQQTHDQHGHKLERDAATKCIYGSKGTTTDHSGGCNPPLCGGFSGTR